MEGEESSPQIHDATAPNTVGIESDSIDLTLRSAQSTRSKPVRSQDANKSNTPNSSLLSLVSAAPRHWDNIPPMVFKNHRMAPMKKETRTPDQARSNPQQKRGIKHNNDVIIGTSYDRTGLIINKQANMQEGRSIGACTGLFVSRLSPECTVKKLSDHIYKKSGYTLTVKRLQTKYSSYNSFHVMCNDATRSALLQPSVWPNGVLVKRFFK